MSADTRAIYDLSFESSAPPERLLAAATDFSKRRPDFWPGITRRQYRVYSLGHHTAEVEEGTAPVHHRYRYDWTDDGLVRATTIDATAVRTGSVWEMRVGPRPGGGSKVHLHLEVAYKGPVGALVGLAMRLTRGGAYRGSFSKTLAILEADA